MKHLIFLILLLLPFHASISQIKESHEVKVLARRQDNRILLRWATTTPTSWVKGNTYGYQLEKFVIARNGERLAIPENKSDDIKVLFQPDPLESWKSIVESNDYAAILAQALYGKGFNVESSNNSNDQLLQIINQSRESEQRFAFGLFAADMSFKASLKAGIGYIDTNTKNNEDYYYRVTSKVPSSILEIKSGGTYVKIKDRTKLPKPIDLFSVPKDKTILLTWEYELFKSLYVGYFVERSENGIDYTPLHKKPLVNMNDSEKSKFSKMQYLDTIPQNDKKYYYRVKGVTSFGEYSPYSEVESNSGYKKLNDVPHITSHKFYKSGDVEINWEFNKKAETDIQYFTLNRSIKDKGKYKILKERINKNERSIIVKELLPSNYFTISAIGKHNQKTSSLPAFVQPIDSIPPNPPIGLEAQIDTTGIVKIRWNPNLEKDILGYRIFRAHTEEEEYIQLTVSPNLEAAFEDKVELKSLNNRVYYKVVAVDQRYNMSEYSEPLIVEKPDLIPPSSPIFYEYKVLEKSVLVKWKNSSSPDIKLYRLLKKDTSNNWSIVTELGVRKGISEWEDTSVKSSTKYTYTIFAEDESGLISQPSTPITITTKAFSNGNIIKSFNGYADRTHKSIVLKWKSELSVKEYTLYRSKNNGVFSLYRQGLSNIGDFIDNRISPNNEYHYSLKAIDIDGNIEFKKTTVNY